MPGKVLAWKQMQKLAPGGGLRRLPTSLRASCECPPFAPQPDGRGSRVPQLHGVPPTAVSATKATAKSIHEDPGAAQGARSDATLAGLQARRARRRCDPCWTVLTGGEATATALRQALREPGTTTPSAADCRDRAWADIREMAGGESGRGRRLPPPPGSFGRCAGSGPGPALGGRERRRTRRAPRLVVLARLSWLRARGNVR